MVVVWRAPCRTERWPSENIWVTSVTIPVSERVRRVMAKKKHGNSQWFYLIRSLGPDPSWYMIPCIQQVTRPEVCTTLHMGSRLLHQSQKHSTARSGVAQHLMDEHHNAAGSRLHSRIGEHRAFAKKVSASAARDIFATQPSGPPSRHS